MEGGLSYFYANKVFLIDDICRESFYRTIKIHVFQEKEIPAIVFMTNIIQLSRKFSSSRNEKFNASKETKN
jgi:hypothetical protein